MVDIKKLRWVDFKDIKGYSTKPIPDATAENMVTLMDKINELTKKVNNLKK